MSTSAIGSGAAQQVAAAAARNVQSQQQAEGEAAVKLIQGADPVAIAAPYEPPEPAEPGKGENIDIKA